VRIVRKTCENQLKAIHDRLQGIETLAREQNRESVDVMEEVVKRYLASQRLARFAEKMELQARSQGTSKEDVPRLIQVRLARKRN
jgi:hypothetical protein